MNKSGPFIYTPLTAKKIKEYFIVSLFPIFYYLLVSSNNILFHICSLGTAIVTRSRETR